MSLVRSTFLLPGLLFLSAAFAQPTWMRTYGGLATNEGMCVRALSDGGALVCGSTGAFGNGSSDAYVLRVDAMGAPIWTSVYGGLGVDQARALVVDPVQGSWISGFTNSQGHGGYDGWLLRLADDGAVIFERTLGTAQWEFLYGADATDDGGVFLAGTTYATDDGSADMWLCRVDADGEQRWSVQFGGPLAEEGRSVRATADGGCVMGGKRIAADGTSDAMVIKFTGDGEQEWEAVIGTPGNDDAYDARQTADGGYVVSGTSGANITFQVLLLAKLDPQGEVLWSYDIGTATDWAGGEVVERPDEGFVMAGWTKAHGGGGSDMYLLHTDHDGSFVWGRTFGGEANDLAVSVDLANDGGYFVAGSTKSHGPGPQAVFVVRTDTSGSTASLNVTVFNDPLSVTTPTIALANVFPNPARSSDIVRIDPPPTGRVQLQLIDPHGRSVGQDIQMDAQGHVQLPAVAAGVYVLEMRADGARRMARLVVER